jgi:hypothetical protein
VSIRDAKPDVRTKLRMVGDAPGVAPELRTALVSALPIGHSECVAQDG